VTASVSEAELADLIAQLTGGTPTGPAPAPRCPITELLVDQCAHCRPAPARVEPELGPWFAAAFRGRCASCDGWFDEFELIRADGAGGWLAQCCGQRDEPRPEDGLIAPAPAPVAHPVSAVRPVPVGPPPSTIRELRQVLIRFESSRPRTMQRALGPSELGTPCQQQIARKLAGAPRRPIVDPTWAPFQGTAVHRSMEDVVAFWNRELGRERWLAEDRLYIDPGLPECNVDPIEGNGDAFDLDHGMVVDWKHTGTTARDKLRRAIRMGKPPAEQVSAEYRVQAHLYGLGHAKKGRDVRFVRLVLLARSHDYDESAEWTEAYDEDIALLAIDRYYATHDLLLALDVATVPDMIAAVPATPHRDTCKWCPFHAPGKPANWLGCPGDRPLERIARVGHRRAHRPQHQGDTVTDANDILMGGGVPTAKFTTVGTIVTGVVVREPEARQQRDFRTQVPGYLEGRLPEDDGRRPARHRRPRPGEAGRRRHPRPVHPGQAPHRGGTPGGPRVRRQRHPHRRHPDRAVHRRRPGRGRPEPAEAVRRAVPATGRIVHRRHRTRRPSRR
jgi:hypothetical protein